MKNLKANVRMSQDGKFLIVNINGETGLVNANLVRYLLGVEYTRKNGTQVSSEEIAQIKRRSQEAYVKKVQEGKTKSA